MSYSPWRLVLGFTDWVGQVDDFRIFNVSQDMPALISTILLFVRLKSHDVWQNIVFLSELQTTPRNRYATAGFVLVCDCILAHGRIRVIRIPALSTVTECDHQSTLRGM